MVRTSTVWNQLSNRILSVDRSREVDRIAVERYRMHSLVLMENAALGCVRWLEQHLPDACKAVVLCGRGNNGGDGLAIARHLRVLGWVCRVVVLGPIHKMSADARANLEILLAGGGSDLLVWEEGQGGVSELRVGSVSEASHSELKAPPKKNEQRGQLHARLIEWLVESDVVIDAMLGTGATGEPKEPLSDWIALANQAVTRRIAIDIPTGWNATTGDESVNTFRADATLTFVARKPAMAFPTAGRVLGEVAVLPIGIPEELIQELLASDG